MNIIVVKKRLSMADLRKAGPAYLRYSHNGALILSAYLHIAKYLANPVFALKNHIFAL
jgi:hypothetical protein